ncbi:MAG: DUF389 domain-containing protein, partial [Syntrophomonadaceae bacterium]|nr:DUF389 domain-containing protein [Syntrophomonadaceae bacterium]
AIIGLVDLRPDFGSEILARTQPNIYDVLIALASGLAGAYAITDERISPALPGVAISTALVPPLATCGLCLAAGFWKGATGALLLFFVNLLAIEVAAGIVFTFLGLVDGPSGRSLMRFLKKFSIRLVMLALVTVFMTQTLVDIITERRLSQEIRAVVAGELDSVLGARLSEVRYDRAVDHLEVMAVVMTPREFEPSRVAVIENRLRQEVDPSIRLVVRSLISKDADRNGPVFLSEEEWLNRTKLLEKDQLMATISALLAEKFRAIPGATMVDLITYDNAEDSQKTVNAVVRTPTPISPVQVKEIESSLNQSLDSGGVRLVVRSVLTRDADSQRFIYEDEKGPQPLSGEALAFHQKLESTLEEQLQLWAPDGAQLVELRYRDLEEGLVVLASVRTPYIIQPSRVRGMETALREQVSPRLQLVVRSVLGAEVSSHDYLPGFDESILNPALEPPAL